MTTQSWIQETTEQDFHFDTTNYGETQSWNEITTPEFNQSNTNIDITQTCQDFTTKEPSQQENFTTTEEITSTMTATTTASVTCPPSITREIVEETKKEIIDRILAIISNEITNKLEAIKEHLLTLTCSNNQNSKPIELSWQIYENLQIPLIGWLRVFDQAYSHQTRIEHLNQIADLCHNHVLVAATFNGLISLAAAGPASVLTLNTTWNQPQLFGQVYWYRTNGKSFGFSPLPTIRQTSADNEDLNSPLRLSWLLDQNIGGYRAGAIRSLPDNSMWHKVIYCN
ncbi:unnamed protein product [Rotaria sordida]|uniref:Uncharacterized protein n=1 Tax=Rotaria sordida TaxID=392033 RepID=A0A814A4U6_9BILA|nr:unnamed protein product [Rotaria sordida]CAF3821887.1 unnamed protein product [Rotaria sordida]